MIVMFGSAMCGVILQLLKRCNYFCESIFKRFVMFYFMKQRTALLTVNFFSIFNRC